MLQWRTATTKAGRPAGGMARQWPRARARADTTTCAPATATADAAAMRLARLVTWGSNQYGQLGVATGSRSRRAARAHHDANQPAPRTVAVGAFGDFSGDLDTVRDIVAGAAHTLVLFTDGRVLSFGCNARHQLGRACASADDARDARARPAHVAGRVALPGAGTATSTGGGGDDKVVAVAAGFEHSLFLTERGRVYACGGNDYGQCGGGDDAGGASSGRRRCDVIEPQRVARIPDGARAVRIAAGVRHSLALLDDGRVIGWGCAKYGKFRLARRHRAATSEEPQRRFVAMVAALYDGAAMDECGAAREQRQPRFVAIAAGLRHSAAMDERGALVTAGKMRGDAVFRTAQYIRGQSDARAFRRAVHHQVASGWSHVLALDAGNHVQLVARGSDAFGQCSRVMDAARDPDDVTAIRCGSESSALVYTDGAVYLFGWNEHGNLGNAPVRGRHGGEGAMRVSELRVAFSSVPDGAATPLIALGGAHVVALCEA